MLPIHQFILSKDKNSISSMKGFIDQLTDVFRKSRDVVPEIGFRGFPYNPFICLVGSKVSVSYFLGRIDELFERKGYSLPDALDVFFSVHQYAMGFELKERELLSSQECFLGRDYLTFEDIFSKKSIVDKFVETWASEEETFFLLSSLGRNEEYVSYNPSLSISKQQAIEWKDFSLSKACDEAAKGLR